MLNYLVLVLIPLAALGQFVLPMQLGDYNFFAFRQLLLLVFVFSWFKFSNKYLNYSVVRYYLITLIIWLLWGMLSLTWTNNITIAKQEILSIIVGLLVCISLLNCKMYDCKNIKYIRFGWILAFLATSIVSLWEMVTGNHLEGHLLLVNIPGLVQASFGNPNNYGAFLVLVFPFLLWAYIIEKKTKNKLYYIIMLFFCFLLVVLTASRVSFFAISTQLFLAIVLLSNNFKKYIGIIALAFVVLVIYNFNDQLGGVYLANKISNIYTEITTLQSAGVRLNLTLSGLLALYNTYGMGLGAGGFEGFIIYSQNIFYVGNSVNPHNFWIQVAAEYGVMVFGLFVGWFLYIIAKLIKYTYNKNVPKEQFVLIRVLIIAIIGYFFSGLANSEYIRQQINWVFIGSLLIMYINSTNNILLSKSKKFLPTKAGNVS